MDNVIELKRNTRMIGTTLSFTITFGDNLGEKINAQAYIERFNEAVRELARTGFEKLENTMISRQEYKP